MQNLNDLRIKKKLSQSELSISIAELIGEQSPEQREENDVQTTPQ